MSVFKLFLILIIWFPFLWTEMHGPEIHEIIVEMPQQYLDFNEEW